MSAHLLSLFKSSRSCVYQLTDGLIIHCFIIGEVKIPKTCKEEELSKIIDWNISLS